MMLTQDMIRRAFAEAAEMLMRMRAEELSGRIKRRECEMLRIRNVFEESTLEGEGQYRELMEEAEALGREIAKLIKLEDKQEK